MPYLENDNVLPLNAIAEARSGWSVANASTQPAGALLEKCGQPSQVRNLLDQHRG
jgi:hypothetical protein